MIARLLLVLALFAGAPALADGIADPFAAARVVLKPGAPLPDQARFRDETGRSVALRDYLGRVPLIVAPVDYKCPNICGTTLADLFARLSEISFRPGRDFQVLAIGLAPGETPEDAARARAEALRAYKRPGAGSAVHFLTGTEQSIAAVVQAVGFHYRWDPELAQYAHPAGFATATADGRVSRWFNALQYSAADLRLGLIEAGGGRVGGWTDQLILLCYHYDPKTGRYDGLVNTVLRVVGGATVASLALLIAALSRRERRKTAGGGL